MHAKSQEVHPADPQLLTPAHLPAHRLKQRLGDQAGFGAQHADAFAAGLLFRRLQQCSGATLALHARVAVKQGNTIVRVSQAEDFCLILRITAHPTLALAE